MKRSRIEKDSMGEIGVPDDAYWGAQTQRAIENFPVSGIAFPPRFIRAIVLLKDAAAAVNSELGQLEPEIEAGIRQACREIADGKYSDQFPLDVFQTGSGTSTNMNVNEVIATRANEILTGSKHTTSPVHPNDHVNRSQSSNDVFPSAIHVCASLLVLEQLLPEMEAFSHAIKMVAQKYRSVIKTGRTHLMDATPLTVEQEMSGWAAQVDHDIARIKGSLPRLSELAIGGTAVGTGLNAPSGFGRRVAEKLSQITGFDFREAENHFEAQAAQDAVVELSGQLKTYSTGLMKICNDLRWMNSGPLSGLHEIQLPSLQPGSSIMPGKVNPVIPEAARMAAVQVVGNDAVIAMANSMGEFELNVMLPVIAHNIIQSITILANVTRLLAARVLPGLEVNEKRLLDIVQRNAILATALNPLIGYEKAAEVVKKAADQKKSVRQVVVELGYLSASEADQALDPRALLGTPPG